MPRISLTLISALLFFGAVATEEATALELREGLVRLELHEAAGRFSLYYLEDIAANK